MLRAMTGAEEARAEDVRAGGKGVRMATETVALRLTTYAIGWNSIMTALSSPFGLFVRFSQTEFPV